MLDSENLLIHWQVRLKYLRHVL